jgi:hypothetical protein
MPRRKAKDLLVNKIHDLLLLLGMNALPPILAYLAPSRLLKLLIDSLGRNETYSPDLTHFVMVGVYI